jgi:hypothetical protein
MLNTCVARIEPKPLGYMKKEALDGILISLPWVLEICS